MWGYINTNNEIVIEQVFFFAKSFSEGLALVQYRDPHGRKPFAGYWKIIDNNGDDVAVLDADLLPHSSFHDGYAVVASFTLTKERQYSGLINRQGELVIDCTYEGIDYIENGFFRARRTDGIDIIKDGRIYFSFLEISRGISAGIRSDDHTGVRNYLEYITEDHILDESGLKYLKLKIFALSWLQDYEEAILLIHDYAEFFPEEQSLHDADLLLNHYLEDRQTDLYCDFIFPRRLKSSGDVSERWWEE